MRLRQAITALFGLILVSVTVQPGLQAAERIPIHAVQNAPAGTKIWLKQNPQLPLIVMNAILPAGSARDSSGKAGLAALSARLLASGALLPPAVRRKLLSHADIRVQIRRDDLRLTVRVTPLAAVPVFRLISRAMSRPVLHQSALKNARENQLQCIAQRQETPANVARDSLMSFYYGPHSYGHPTAGSADGLKAIRRADLRAFMRRFWIRDNIMIAFAGDLDAATAARLTKLAFGRLPEKTVPELPAPYFAGAPGLHVIPATTREPTAIFALPGPKRGDTHFLAAEVANYILGRGRHSRLRTALGDKNHLSYQISTSLEPRAAAGLMTGTLSADPRKMREALSLVRRSLRKFAFEGPENAEFQDAKRFLRDSFVLNFASDQQSAATMADLMARGWQISDVEGYAKRIEKLSLRDVRAMAKQLYSSENLTIVVAGPLAHPRRSSNPYRR